LALSLLAVPVVLLQTSASASAADTFSFRASAGPPVPIGLTLNPAREISETSATFTAEITAHGAPVSSCQFEWRSSAGPSFRKTKPCEPGAASLNLGDTTEVSADVNGLLANTEYHVRITAVNEAGPVSTENTFSTFASSHSASTGDPAVPAKAV